MDPSGPTAARFPLVARFRPACSPLPVRVSRLVELAETGERQGDQVLASTVYNQSALLASDVGLPDLAREMCHQHADAYLRASPMPAMSAIRGLEPLVNLARLQIRAGRTDDGRNGLLALYEAVTAGDSAVIEDIAIPAFLTASTEDRREVSAWLWRVLLADGTRTLTTTGHWQQALNHIEKHHGVGTRMLDGRQVAVLAALTEGDTGHTEELLAHTAPGDPWEQTVTACLTTLFRLDTGLPVGTDVANLTSCYLAHEAKPGLTVFDIRLGLTILDIADSAEHPAANHLAENLVRRTLEARDGYAAREILAHPLTASVATNRQIRECRNLLHACALGAKDLPIGLRDDLTTALQISDRVIRNSLTRSASPRM